MLSTARTPVAALARYAPLAQTLGLMLIIFGLSLLFPLAFSHFLADGAEATYDEALVVTVGCGAVLWLVARGHEGELHIRDGFLLVALAWTVLPAFATLPLMLYLPDLSFTDAYFETVSGLTTSGATILDGLDKLPPSINIWRAQLVWMGGMGVVVLAVAILPLLGVGGAQVFKAETPGPMKDTKLTPRITETAKGLWGVYFVITIACILAMKLAGMTWLDAIIHAFSTMGLGGFSSHDASFGFFDSPVIEAVTIAFMLVASLNFATHFLAWRARSLRPYARDPEAGMVMLAMLGASVLVAAYLWHTGYYAELLAVAPLRRVQRHLGREHHRFRQHGLQRMAGVRAAADAVPELLRHLLRLDRRRDEDGPRAGAAQGVVPRVHADPPPARRGAAEGRRPADREQPRVRRARVHARLRPDDRRHVARDDRDRARLHHARSRRWWPASTTWARVSTRSGRRRTTPC